MFGFLTKRFSSLFDGLTSKKRLTQTDIDASLATIRQSLLEADVPYELVGSFCQKVSAQAIGHKVLDSLKPADQLVKLVHDELKQFLSVPEHNSFSVSFPSTLMVVGLQGSGKTTSLAKIANWVKKEEGKKGKRVKILMGSVDFYRPAAIDQLQILSRKLKVDFYRCKETDVVRAAQELADYARLKKYDLLLFDTAGRLHVDDAMLQELRSVVDIVKPNKKVIVLDAMTGQESLAVARSFESAIGFDSAVMSKMDSETSGGAAFAFCYALKKPISFVGTGEKIADFEQFIPERMAGRILGMGDVVTLAEQVEERVAKSEQKKLEDAFMSGRFTFEDFLSQMAMMDKIGSLSKISSFLPGMGKMKLSENQLQEGEKQLRRFRAIISSMTPKERRCLVKIDASRTKRIAHGAGVSKTDVGLLLQRFKQSQQYVKLFKSFGQFNTFNPFK